MSLCQVTSENNTFMITDTGAAEVQVTMVETNVHKTGHGEDRNDEVSEKVLSPSTHREETLTDSKGVKRDPEPSHHNVSKADVDLYSNTNTKIAPPTLVPGSPPKSPATLPSTQTTPGSEEAKLKSETTLDTLSKVGYDANKKTVLFDTNGEKTICGEERHDRGDRKGTQEMDDKRKTGRRVIHSVKDALTIAESDTTEARVRFV